MLGEILKSFALLNSEAIGWSLVCILLASLVWIAVQWIKSSGEVAVAKQSAGVSLNEQANGLILRMVEEQKAELKWLREKAETYDAAMREHLRVSERLCDHLIAICSETDPAMQQYYMARAQDYLIEIGKWPKDA